MFFYGHVTALNIHRQWNVLTAVCSQELSLLQKEAKAAMDVAADAAEEMVATKRVSSGCAQEDAWKALHLRSAEKLLWLARENKGVSVL